MMQNTLYHLLRPVLPVDDLEVDPEEREELPEETLIPPEDRLPELEDLDIDDRPRFITPDPDDERLGDEYLEVLLRAGEL